MKKNYHGFTLIETLLVLVIISMIIFSGLGYLRQRTLQMRMDRVSLQMQQILNAGLAFYVTNNKWPQQLSDLQGTYLPPTTVPLKNPWGQLYVVDGTNVEKLIVYTSTVSASSSEASTAANVIAGMLPMSYTSTTVPSASATPTACTTQTTCYIVSSVNIPGQNLNNARAINFSGLYKHGACVPVPQCPVDVTGNTMTAQVFVAPVQVAGTYDGGLSTSNPNVYPISSFSAYATPKVPAGNNPVSCTGGKAPDCSALDGGTVGHWRVCVQVVTERGVVSDNSAATPPSPNWGDNQTIMALTRCVTNNEPAGSPFNIYP